MPYFWYGFLGSLALGAFNNYFIGNRLLATASDIIWRIIFLDVEFLFTVGFQLLTVGVKSGYQLFNVLSSTFSLFTTLFDVTLSCFRKNEYLATTLEDKCENVLVRLNSIDEISAQEKKDVLQALLLQIKTNVDEGKQTFKDGLKHKFTVVHNDQEHHISFLEVASTRRAHQGRFNLDKQPGYMCFFRAETTTETLIGVESSETLGLAK